MQQAHSTIEDPKSSKNTNSQDYEIYNSSNMLHRDKSQKTSYLNQTKPQNIKKENQGKCRKLQIKAELKRNRDITVGNAREQARVLTASSWGSEPDHAAIREDESPRPQGFENRGRRQMKTFSPPISLSPPTPFPINQGSGRGERSGNWRLWPCLRCGGNIAGSVRWAHPVAWTAYMSWPQTNICETALNLKIYAFLLQS